MESIKDSIRNILKIGLGNSKLGLMPLEVFKNSSWSVEGVDSS
ncbi:hypothetical protein Bandiella_00127 [Candidatus Bandiella woodruffii]|uniref:Uncharacterized protein n=1 Tax=Candidatus Bandiella euplotis TaxID=1664265 RepID=A0ABZ0UIW5_9RICK|nr:hypothetical protein Bandiella_00127 [Candidatus Bandiella woodruffii]